MIGIGKAKEFQMIGIGKAKKVQMIGHKKTLAALGVAASLGLAATALAATPFSDGAFETPTAPSGSFTEYYAGNSFGPWHVDSGSIDLIDGGFWLGADGCTVSPCAGTHDQSLDMNGAAPGAISQSFDTTVGHQYTVTFWLSRNYANPGSVTLTVAADATGAPSAPYTFSGSNSSTSMGWLKEAYTFTASGATTKLSFSGDPNAGAVGPALDNVSIADMSPTSTNTPTNTSTPTPTATNTSTPTPTATATNTPTNTATNTLTATNTPTRTSTPVPPTATTTPSATPTTVSAGGGALGGSGAATPELGSGELLATGLLPALALLLYRRRRARR